MYQHVNKFVVVWALALTAVILMGMDIPNRFSSGDVISSAQMNENFEAVKEAVDVLESTVTTFNEDVARLAQLETTVELLTDRVAGLESDTQALDENLTLLEQRVDALDASLDNPSRVIGMVRVDSSGVLTKSWMANGNTPTVYRHRAGQYHIDWPGESVHLSHQMLLVSVDDTAGAYATVHSNGAGAPTVVFIHQDVTQQVNRSFWAVLMSK